MKEFFDRIVSEFNDSPAATGDDVANPSANGHLRSDAGEVPARTPAEIREVTQELLKHGYLEEAQSAEIFRRALVHQHEIAAVLEPLDLMLRLDSHRGVAFLAIAPVSQESPCIDDGWAHPLVRRQRLTLEQSLLVALLRQAFVVYEQESGVGQGAAIVAVDQLLPQFMAYMDDSGSDMKNESRLLSLLDQLKTYGIVSEVDKKQEVTIRPLIAHLANPESLAALLALLKEQRQDLKTPESNE
jgi:hypothetical protein